MHYIGYFKEIQMDQPKKTTTRYIVVDDKFGMDLVIHTNLKEANIDAGLYPQTHIVVEVTTEWENVMTTSRTSIR
jgi:hypothetical protein